ncbi:Hsp20/alpha crystallin family protein [Photobacterium sp.]|uniref:Hsp20/alpha crystallin family protein n=1 Tax=Photobacterium sp. TaxID=660 RepID=UPI00299CFC4A|nr:Hsp20/alpha crystallin family protein [Photobacterium sp.]MDX1300841.1 Hsp20/alpha crystallin family protein [Photobacterium sp.]
MSNEQYTSEQKNRHYISPRVDISEDPDGISLYADMPGVTRDGLFIEALENKLSIKGEINLEPEVNYTPIMNEVHYNGYSREFTLSKEFDSANISASFNDGVLYLHIPKREELKPTRIKISVD